MLLLQGPWAGAVAIRLMKEAPVGRLLMVWWWKRPLASGETLGRMVAASYGL